MQQRNRLLADDVRDGARFEAFERIMAEAGVAIAAARAVAVAELVAAIGARRDAGVGALFPWAELALVGTLEAALAARPRHRGRGRLLSRLLRRERERDRAAGRTLDGPHRSDLAVGHGPKELPAKVCSTGEQKALLIGLVLAHCDVVRQAGRAPRPSSCSTRSPPTSTPCGGPRCSRRSSPWAARRGCRAPIADAFAGLGERGQFLRVEEGRIAPFR